MHILFILSQIYLLLEYQLVHIFFYKTYADNLLQKNRLPEGYYSIQQGNKSLFCQNLINITIKKKWVTICDPVALSTIDLIS